MARLDYYRVGYTYRPDDQLAVQHAQVLLKLWEGEVATWDAPGGNHTEKVYVRGGSVMQVFECWGKQAAQPWVAGGFHEDNSHLLKLLRIDIRQELPSDANFDLIRATRNPKGRRNLHDFNSRPRNKKGDRDAGGIGFGIGSHKGSTRLSIYRRGKEQPAIELMLRTKQLVDLNKRIAERRQVAKHGAPDALPFTWLEDCVTDYMGDALTADVRDEFGLTLGEFVNGDWRLSGERLEAHAAFVARQVALLPAAHQQLSFLDALAKGVVEAGLGDLMARSMEKAQ